MAHYKSALRCIYSVSIMVGAFYFCCTLCISPSFTGRLKSGLHKNQGEKFHFLGLCERSYSSKKIWLEMVLKAPTDMFWPSLNEARRIIESLDSLQRCIQRLSSWCIIRFSTLGPVFNNCKGTSHRTCQLWVSSTTMYCIHSGGNWDSRGIWMKIKYLLMAFQCICK